MSHACQSSSGSDCHSAAKASANDGSRTTSRRTRPRARRARRTQRVPVEAGRALDQLGERHRVVGEVGVAVLDHVPVRGRRAWSRAPHDAGGELVRGPSSRPRRRAGASGRRAGGTSRARRRTARRGSTTRRAARGRPGRRRRRTASGSLASLSTPKSTPPAPPVRCSAPSTPVSSACDVAPSMQCEVDASAARDRAPRSCRCP